MLRVKDLARRESRHHHDHHGENNGQQEARNDASNKQFANFKIRYNRHQQIWIACGFFDLQIQIVPCCSTDRSSDQ